MASNRIPRSPSPIFNLLDNAADGAKTLGTVIELKQNVEANIRAHIVTIMGRDAGPGGVPPAILGSQYIWNKARGQRVAAHKPLKAACKAGTTLLRACVNSLKPVLGERWNKKWEAAGFNNHSLRIHANPMVQLFSMRGYYSNNPTHEVPALINLSLTATACEAAAQAISDATEAYNHARGEAVGARRQFKADLAAARRRLIGLRDELTQLLDKNDLRWKQFGFQVPGHLNIPETPTELAAQAGGQPGMLAVSCRRSRRGKGYRFRITDAAGNELVEVLSDSTAKMIPDLPSGATVTITVTAHNASGDSAPSPAITAIVP